VRLDPESLQKKLVAGNRGGYCFEHSSLLAQVLEQLRYEVSRRAARVVLMSPATETPRTHMFMTVQLPEGAYVVDPGFGGYGPHFPVPLNDSSANSGPTHRFSHDGSKITLQFCRGDQFVDGWVSDLAEENHPIDFEVGNYFTAMHPQSMFRQIIMMSIVTPTGRVSVMNRDVSYHSGSEVTPKQLVDRREFRKLLVDHYGFDLPEFDTLRIPAIPEWDSA
ncbi:MAG: arylamine N-acetyltransferase family protein, partial [Vulcanimicrobiaceae bacterium]